MVLIWKKRLLAIVKGWGFSLFLGALIATSFKSAIADWNLVPTGSMKPTIVEGDRIFINKLAYDLKIPYTTFHVMKWGDPQRGEIVVFYSPEDGTRLVKRVVGMPGDQLAMRNEKIFINGQPLTYLSRDASAAGLQASARPERMVFEENLIGRHHDIQILPDMPALRSFGPVMIPANHYFMMGDNRDNSADSRYFGFVDRKLIVGRASSIVISLDKEKMYAPRFSRFFTALR
jgi:signal peptidase I